MYCSLIILQCKAVLDIGGQDLKAIAIDERGRVSRFEMNDRCAAGTGQFLESMARRLGFPLNQFGDAALIGKPGLTISAMCAVFAGEFLLVSTFIFQRERLLGYSTRGNSLRTLH